MVNIDRVKNLAKEKGVTITHLCKIVGQGAWFLNDVAKGKVALSSENLNIISVALGTTPAYLCNETDIKEKSPSNDRLSAEAEEMWNAYNAASPEVREAIEKLLKL